MRRREFVFIALALLCAAPAGSASFSLGHEERIFLTEHLRSTCEPGAQQPQPRRQLCATLNISSASLETRCITSRTECTGALDIFISDASSCKECPAGLICGSGDNDSFCTSEQSFCEDQYVACGPETASLSTKEASDKAGNSQGIALFILGMLAIVLCCVFVFCIVAVVIRIARRKAVASEGVSSPGPSSGSKTVPARIRREDSADIAIPMGEAPSATQRGHRAIRLALSSPMRM